MSMSGKYTIVTGGSRGIGRAIVEEFSRRGSAVAIADINEERAKSTAREISEINGNQVIGVKADVSDHESAKEMVKQVVDTFGKVDILINNAGVTRDNLIIRISEEDWDIVLNVNLKGAFNCSQAVIRPMMKQRYGRIVNISSVSGLAGQAGQTNYSASKAGLIGFTKALAREVASRKITVNAVAPGFIPTALTVDLPDEFKEWAMNLTPAGRMGEPEEVAYAVAFLASDEAAYITGQVLSVDGGMMMM
jgi:3-oxoacyl-[acyl-carrier protein] reductase